MELHEIQTWGEKEKGARGTLRVYCGGMWVGQMHPVKGDTDKYFFRSNWDMDVLSSITSPTVMSDILLHVECSLKEFVNKLVKPRKLVKIDKAKGGYPHDPNVPYEESR